MIFTNIYTLMNHYLRQYLQQPRNRTAKKKMFEKSGKSNEVETNVVLLVNFKFLFMILMIKKLVFSFYFLYFYSSMNTLFFHSY